MQSEADISYRVGWIKSAESIYESILQSIMKLSCRKGWLTPSQLDAEQDASILKIKMNLSCRESWTFPAKWDSSSLQSGMNLSYRVGWIYASEWDKSILQNGMNLFRRKERIYHTNVQKITGTLKINIFFICINLPSTKKTHSQK